MAVAEGANLLSYQDSVSRNESDWFDAVVIQYAWKDDAGVERTAYDNATKAATQG